jgi:hypothetical protein
MNSLNVAVVFAGRNALDQADIRLGVLRIPEVTQILREAQISFDKYSSQSFDLRAFLMADDREFLAQSKLKSLVATLVQIALFERWQKFHSKPNYLIGNSNHESALQFAAGRKNLDEIIRESSFVVKSNPNFLQTTNFSSTNEAIDHQNLPILGGANLVEYEISILNHSTQKYISIRQHEMDALRLFAYMADQLPIDQLVNVGPGCPLFSNYNKILAEKKIQVLDSIDLDPMLNWFWSSVKPADVVSQ